jgi:iron complex transport system permease protein
VIAASTRRVAFRTSADPRVMRRRIAVGVLIATFVAFTFLTLGIGPVSLGAGEVIRTLLDPARADNIARIAVWDVRLPRLLIGACAGASLAVSGGLLQMILRNPLAAPELTGVSQGAVVAALIALTYFHTTDSSFTLPLIATAGGAAAGVAVYGLSRRRSGTDPTRLILIGVIVASTLSGVISVLMVTSGAYYLHVMRWLVGSLESVTFDDWMVMWPKLLICLALVALTPIFANVLQLGDEIATGLGVRAELARFGLLGVAVVLAAVAVSTVGALSFVGLVAPHIARMLVGGDGRRLLPFAAGAGATLVVAADLLARNFRLSWIPILNDLLHEGSARGAVPVGVFLALVGAPFFMYLIFTRRP